MQPMSQQLGRARAAPGSIINLTPPRSSSKARASRDREQSTDRSDRSSSSDRYRDAVSGTVTAHVPIAQASSATAFVVDQTSN